MIDQVGEGNRLTIGEGVETTLAGLVRVKTPAAASS